MSEGRDPALASPKVWGTWAEAQEEAGEAIDHLVQSFDPTDRPGALISTLCVNYQAFADDPDWLHVNSVAYHPELTNHAQLTRLQRTLDP